MATKIGDIVGFKEELFFDGAVQADWFYEKEKASLVAKNYVFHGSEFFGFSQNEITEKNIIDTISFTNFIIEKIYSDDAGINPFTLAIAGYGSGKSHLAVTLASLLSNFDADTVDKIINNISKIDSNAAEKIKSKISGPNLVLTLNGINDFNLNYEILKCAKKSLQFYGLNDDILMKISSAYETAKRFNERYFHVNAKAFEIAAKKHGIKKSSEALFDYINENLGTDDAIYDVVNEVYSDITGHEIRWDQGISAGQILEVLSNEFCISQGIFNKVILIFDEFGRYLEYASEYKSKAGDSALQQIFEATQNTEGNVQFIGFIQSDIKTYLTRVEQTSNISRYIGRYDRSDKFHLSSNLETIFANIIDRPNRDLFNKYIINSVDQDENSWNDFLCKMQRWIPNLKTRGIWSDYNSFKKVIVKGIYPFHPLTTYMLSSMTDWLQNRSSLTLLNNKIKEVHDKEIDDKLFLIYPTDILDDELFAEILAAEEEGRQRTRYATIYDNILKKYRGRLNSDELLVLKANLIIKICKISANSKDDLIYALNTCAHLDKEIVEKALEYLEVEYGVLSYDERACSFEFIEDSMGASDFRAFIKRKTIGTSISFDLFLQEPVKEIAGVIKPISVDFGVKKYITTNEWQFEQNLFFISDFSDKDLKRILTDMEKRYFVDKAKGSVIWLYTNKNISYTEIEKIQALISNVSEDIALRFFLLDDSDNALYNNLIDYYVAYNVTGDDALKYGRYLEEHNEKVKNKLAVSFENLKSERKLITDKGIITEGIVRLPVYLSSVFEKIYPRVIPFTFDGFAGKAGTITKTRKILCAIEKFLCWDVVDYQSIKTQPVDVQKRFDSILSGAGPMSWRVITNDGKLVPPKRSAIEEIYNEILDELDANQSLNLGQLINKLRRPPYGINDMAISLLLIVFLAIQKFRIKLMLDGQKYSLSNWADFSISDSNINIDIFGKTEIKVVDSVDVRKKYKALFDEINSNSSIGNIEKLSLKLDGLLQEEDLPEDLKDSCTLAKQKLSIGMRYKETYLELLGSYKEVYEQFKNSGEVMLLIKHVERNMYPSRNLGTGYVLNDNEIDEINRYNEYFKRCIEKDFTEWADRTLRLRSVNDSNRFEGKLQKLCSMLDNLGYTDFAAHARSIMNRELSNMTKVRELEMVASNIKTFLNDSYPHDNTDVSTLNQWKDRINILLSNLKANSLISDYDKKVYEEKLKARGLLLDQKLEEIKLSISRTWDEFFDAETNDDLINVQINIERLLRRPLPQQDVDSLISARNFIAGYFEEDQAYNLYSDNRKEINSIYSRILSIYSDENLEFDFTKIIENRYQQIISGLDSKEEKWKLENIIEMDYSNKKQLKKWLEDTRILPGYLSEKTLQLYEQMRIKVETALKSYRFEYVISLIKSLTKEEWIKVKQVIDGFGE